MKISNTKDLKQIIAELEQKKELKKTILIENAKEIYTNIQPRNLVKALFNNVTTSATLQNKLLNAVLGIGSGIITNKIVTNKSSSLIKKITGRVIQLGVTGLITKNANKIKAVSQAIVKNIFKKK